MIYSTVFQPSDCVGLNTEHSIVETTVKDSELIHTIQARLCQFPLPDKQKLYTWFYLFEDTIKLSFQNVSSSVPFSTQ